MCLWLSILCSILTIVTGLPALNTSHGFSTGHISLEDYTFIRSLPKTRAGTLPGFKYVYVDSTGQWSYNKDPSKSVLEIAGSPRTTWQAVLAAADYVIKMTRYMPANIFNNLASYASVGIFSASEKLIVYPEYADLANNNCGTSCSGTCSQTCTFDGRKYEDIAGVGGQRAVILDDNILCSPRDPYGGKENILAHEFTHTIQLGLGIDEGSSLRDAYYDALAAHTWTLSSYAMQNDKEYFAEAATVFFGVNVLNTDNTGGMSYCSANTFCSGEMEGREHLRRVDPKLYGVLSYVFTTNRPSLPSGLTVCPASHTLVG
ncbi:hypothetical protein Btru_070129 [Bulinus truncatus]|nr:hypothetical protein Btru_070129 [Bulinus truncatus]